MKRKINKLFVLFSVLVFVSCRTIRTVAYDIEEARVSGEIRIVQISDFHSNDFGKDENKINNLLSFRFIPIPICVTKRPEACTMRRSSGRPACDFVRSACGSLA